VQNHAHVQALKFAKTIRLHNKPPGLQLDSQFKEARAIRVGWSAMRKCALNSALFRRVEVPLALSRGRCSSEKIIKDGGHVGQSLGLSMFGNTVLMCWFASILRPSLRTLHMADAFPSFRDYAQF
jgi:hypothetical protein